MHPTRESTGGVPVSGGLFAKETPDFPGINPRSILIQKKLQFSPDFTRLSPCLSWKLNPQSIS
jgi:hypothetical protein